MTTLEHGSSSMNHLQADLAAYLAASMYQQGSCYYLLVHEVQPRQCCACARLSVRSSLNEHCVRKLTNCAICKILEL